MAVVLQHCAMCCKRALLIHKHSSNVHYEWRLCCSIAQCVANVLSPLLVFFEIKHPGLEVAAHDRDQHFIWHSEVSILVRNALRTQFSLCKTNCSLNNLQLVMTSLHLPATNKSKFGRRTSTQTGGGVHKRCHGQGRTRRSHQHGNSRTHPVVSALKLNMLPWSM